MIEAADKLNDLIHCYIENQYELTRILPHVDPNYYMYEQEEIPQPPRLSRTPHERVDSHVSISSVKSGKSVKSSKSMPMGWWTGRT